MPELPEVETIVRGLRAKIIGQKIKSIVTDGNCLAQSVLDFQRALVGAFFLRIERHGKYIIVELDSGASLIIHLRMTGQLFFKSDSSLFDKHVHIQIEFENGTILYYRDIRKFGRWSIVASDAAVTEQLAGGIDALKLTELHIANLLVQLNPKKILKAFLLDQNYLAGIGNIYADEICALLQLQPQVTLARAQKIFTQRKKNFAQELTQAIKLILAKAIRNKGTSVSDYLTSSGARGKFQNLLVVYGQNECGICGGVTQKIKVAGRTSSFCPRCQKK